VLYDHDASDQRECEKGNFLSSGDAMAKKLQEEYTEKEAAERLVRSA
jgi:hypothetical protein